MELLNEKSWFAIQAKPHREDVAAGSVGELDLECFLPKIKQEQLVCGTARPVIKPLFRGYFFARFCAALSLDAVCYARGVLRVLGTTRFPIPIAEEVIDQIRARVRDDGFVKLEAKPFCPGDTVVIEEGPFAGLVGQVEREFDDGKRVAILLEAMQLARVLIEKRWVTLTPEG